MDRERQGIDSTDLIDVSDVSPRFEEGDTERRIRSHGEGIPGLSSSQEALGPTIACLKDRCAALLIDAAFLYLLYWASMLIYRAVALGSVAGPIPAAGMSGLLFHGIFLFLAFLWFIVPEMAFSASVGKLFCHLTIRRVDGSYPSFLSVLLRNLLKPIDLILFPLFIMAAVLEWTAWHQRLGDFIGRTIVLRKLGSPPRQYALSLDIIATASGRAIAFLIDIALFAAFAGGWSLLLTPERPLSSMLLVLLFPVAAVLFFALPAWATKTSPGKWLLGYAICLEDGSAIDLPSTIIRTLWLPVDCNLVGFLTCFFSLRRQRSGDVAAGTVVINAPREWRGLFGIALVLFISCSVLYSGLQNRESYLHEGFQVNFLPSIDISGKFKGKKGISANLATTNFRFAAGDPNSLRKPSIFQPGETLFLVFEVDGYKRDDGKVWIQEDISVRYPDDSIGLKLENINDFNQEVDQEGPIRFENNMAIPDTASPGRYTVTITIRDKLARQELKEQRFFYVTASGSKEQQDPSGVPDKPGEGTTQTPATDKNTPSGKN